MERCMKLNTRTRVNEIYNKRVVSPQSSVLEKRYKSADRTQTRARTLARHAQSRRKTAHDDKRKSDTLKP